jgi:error-prone DNA polymerase
MLPYVELHARSAFSFLRGASIPESYAAHCAELVEQGSATPAMALTDVDGVYGSVRFRYEAKKRKIRAHVGAEVSGWGGRYTLLCESRQGYQNLCRLITRIKLRAGAKHPKPGREAQAMLEDLAEFAGGLICLTGGEEGPLAHALERGDASAATQRLLAIYGRENVFVELQRHLDPEGEKRNQAAVDLARAWKLRWSRPMESAMPRVPTAHSRCLYLPRQQDHARQCRAFTGAQLRALLKERRGDERAIQRPAGGDRQHHRYFVAPAVHARRFGL